MSHRTIMYIEDNGSMLELVIRMLQSKGYTVVAETNGYSGLTSIRKQQPDLILLDINMPGMSGYEVLAEIRKDSEIAHLPVIALTANGLQGSREECLNAGFDEYIAKPITRQELTSLVEDVLARRQAS